MRGLSVDMGVSRVTPAASIGLDTTSMLAGTASRTPAFSICDPTGRLASHLRVGMEKECGAGCQTRTGDLMLTSPQDSYLYPLI